MATEMTVISLPEAAQRTAIPLIFILLLAGCAAPAAPAVPTPIVQVIIVTQVMPGPTYTPYPTYTLYPTYTPAPQMVITATPLPFTMTPISTAIAVQATVSIRKSITGTVPSATQSTASSSDDVFYSGLVKCASGTDLIHWLTEDSPDEIIHAYEQDQYRYAGRPECQQAFEAKIVSSRQRLACVATIPDSTDEDLKAVKQSTLAALQDLLKIREGIFQDSLCGMKPEQLNLKEAYLTFDSAKSSITHAQTLLDQYRHAHGK